MVSNTIKRIFKLFLLILTQHIFILLSELTLSLPLRIDIYTVGLSIFLAGCTIALYKAFHLKKTKDEERKRIRPKNSIIFWRHIKVFAGIYTILSLFFQNFNLIKWPVHWPILIISFSFLTIITGILRFFIKNNIRLI